MKALVAFLILVANVAQADILDFSVVRSGGGQMENVVALDAMGQVAVFTKSCSFKNLTPEEQASTRFTLSGKSEADARAILEGKAIVASRVSFAPPMPTGTWLSVKVNYTQSDFHGHVAQKSEDVSSPVVVVGEKLSDVIAEIDTQARTAASAVCR